MKGSDFYRIEKAIYFLFENAIAQPSLADLSKFIGLSEHHCHRLFKRWVGITPKDFLQIATLSKAKSLLLNSKSVIDTSIDVGLSSSSRLHDLFLRYEAMTPGNFKTGGELLKIRWDFFDSPLGNIALAVTDHGICSLNFFDKIESANQHLKANWPNATLEKDPKRVKPIAEEIRARMRGERENELKLLMRGTPFQVKVWEALLKIPEGRVTTYQEIANLIGAPKAVRAVGTAIGANPIGYLIPCHRVIKSTGIIGKYRWGEARKAGLLAIEQPRG
jgi:AraC family transcriptional regulator of adaptative response/methylated-DNA-[protein]-cysteine methyltransferase